MLNEARQTLAEVGVGRAVATCTTLMAMPQARGHFHRVWTMSGQQATATPRDMATRNAEGVFRAAGLCVGDVRGLGTLSMDRLIAASRGSRYNGPVVDGVVLPRDPLEPDATPLSRDIPLVMGNTREETTLLIGAADPSLFNLTWDALPGTLGQHLASYLGDRKPETVVERWRKWYPGQLSFARTGNPNTPSLPRWPTYGLANRETMLFDVTCTSANDPRGQERRFVETISYRQPGTWPDAAGSMGTKPPSRLRHRARSAIPDAPPGHRD